MSKKRTQFRIRAKNYFLTQPKCYINIKDVIENLTNICIEKKNTEIFMWAICKEFNENNEPHIHVSLQFHDVVAVYKPTFFDLEDVNEKGEKKIQHGNYQGVKNLMSILHQIQKGKQLQNGTEILFSDLFDLQTNGGVTNKIEVEAVIIKLAELGKIDQAINLYKRQKPKQQLTNKKRIRESLQDIQEQHKPFEPKQEINEFNPPKELKDYLESFEKKSKEATLWCHGPSGTGKTSYFSHWLHSKNIQFLTVQNQNDFKYYQQDSHKAILLDDYTFPKDLEKFKQTVCPANLAGIRILYGHVKLNPDCIKIVTSNVPLEFYLEKIGKNQPEEMVQSIRRRVNTISISNYLYSDKKTIQVIESKRFSNNEVVTKIFNSTEETIQSNFEETKDTKQTVKGSWFMKQTTKQIVISKTTKITKKVNHFINKIVYYIINSILIKSKIYL